MSGANAVYVAAAYGLAALVVAALVAFAALDHRALLRKLARFGGRR